MAEGGSYGPSYSQGAPVGCLLRRHRRYRGLSISDSCSSIGTDQLNTYAYVGGNPVSYVDPMGLEGVTSALAGMPQQASVFDRSPDLVTAQLSLYVLGFSATLDRYRNVYLSGAFGRGYPGPKFSDFGGFVAAGWLGAGGDCPPSEDKTRDFIAGGSMGAAGVFKGIGGGLDYSPGGSTGVLLGLGANGFGLGGGYGALCGNVGGAGSGVHPSFSRRT